MPAVEVVEKPTKVTVSDPRRKDAPVDDDSSSDEDLPEPGTIMPPVRPAGSDSWWPDSEVWVPVAVSTAVQPPVVETSTAVAEKPVASATSTDTVEPAPAKSQAAPAKS